VYGPVFLRGPLDDNTKVKITIYKKQGGEYRLMPYNFPLSDWCSAINNDPYVYPDVAKSSNISLPLDCPVIDVRKDSNESSIF
jgi:hypothetical protein